MAQNILFETLTTPSDMTFTSLLAVHPYIHREVTALVRRRDMDARPTSHFVSALPNAIQNDGTHQISKVTYTFFPSNFSLPHYSHRLIAHLAVAA